MSKLQQALASVKAPTVSIKGVQGATFTAQNVQAQQTNQTNYSGQLLGIAQLGSQLYADYVDRREKQGKERAAEILMKKMQPEQIRELRQSGALLYQDDPYAMRALERELGRQEAYNVDAMVRERIANGDYPTRAAMEQDRSDMMESARDGMAQTYGIEPTSEYFREGMQADIVERNMAIYDAQARKQDQRHRNEARVVIESNLGSLVNSGNGGHVLSYLQDMKNKGVIRNDAEFETYAIKAVKDLSQRPNSIDQVRAIMDSDIPLYGGKTTLRARLGEEMFRNFENSAAESTLRNNQETQRWFTQTLNYVANPDLTQDGAELQAYDNLAKLEQFASQTQGTEQATAVRQQIEQAKIQLENKLRAKNQAKQQELAKQQQQYVRLAAIDERVEGRLSGDNQLSLKLDSFESNETTGEYTKNDLNAYYRMKMDEIKNDPQMSQEQKALKVLNIGALLKDEDKAGFSAHFGEMINSATQELNKYGVALDAGAELPPTPTLDSMMELYKADKQKFVSVFGSESSLITDLAAGATLGVHPARIAQGRIVLDKMPKDARMAMSLEFQNMMSKTDDIYNSLPDTQKESLQAAYVGMSGLSNADRVKVLNEHLKDQYQSLTDRGWFNTGHVRGVVPKTFLMGDPTNPSSVDVGKAKLQKYITTEFGDNGLTSVSAVGDTLLLWNTLRNTPRYLTKEELMKY